MHRRLAILQEEKSNFIQLFEPSGIYSHEAKIRHSKISILHLESSISFIIVARMDIRP
jgi:hypothetical protein